MWVYNSDYNRWESTGDKLTLSDYELLKQELSSVRFYSKCLSGATYLPINNLDNIYDILGSYQPRNWYLSTVGSVYSNTNIPAEYSTPINGTSSFDFYTRYLSEYGLTLKNLFTPERLIKDSINNYIDVDAATTTQLTDLTLYVINRSIDGVKLKNGHRVLIKDQKDRVTLPNTTDPDTYFLGEYELIQNFGATIEYEIYSSDNGIYVYNDGILTKTDELDDYDNCKRLSVLVKNGDTNFDKQFHLVRLLNGYFPTTANSEPIQFIENHNWLLRNRVDYNNLFEINYYDVFKHPLQVYFLDGVTYSIPERIISVGEFGIILNNQNGVSNIINNKYKVNLRSISQTSKFYWICGDDGVLLKVRKHDFFISKVDLGDVSNNLRSVSFYDDLKGVVVGDLNTVYVTENGGHTWENIKVSSFDSYYFNKVIYYSPSAFFVAGNVGVFIEFKKDIYGWTALKRRISKILDDDDEYLLVDNINDIFYTTTTSWGLSYSYSTQSVSSDKSMLFLVTDDSKIIVHDINGFSNFNFLYLEFPNKYDDIRNITRRESTNDFYFTGIDESTGDTGLFSFDLTDFQYIGVGNSYSNTILSTVSPVYESDLYGNDIFDYQGQDLIICGNESLLETATYSSPFNFGVLDSNFESRLKSKLLFLDYDAGSKLNFFDDFGDYRLPESITVPTSLTSLEFLPLVYGATSPSYMTQSEVNWFKYWQDGKMTFEYYSSNPMNEATKVLISPSFSYSSIQSEISISSVTYDEADIINLAPSISIEGHSRFNSVGMTAISAPISPYDLYLHDYLMIAKTTTSYPISVGDVMRLDSDVVTDNFIVNKIADLSGDRYIYMYSEFNQNIITGLSSSNSPITLTNLNSFSTTDELIERFNIHPISYGYELSYTEEYGIDQVLMDFSNGGLTTSYTNWSFSSGFTSSSYINLFGTQTSASYSLSTFAVGDQFIETPIVNGVDNISFAYTSTIGNYSPIGTYSYINIQGLSGSNWIDINTYNIGNGVTGAIATTVSIPVNYNYTKFRFNLRTSSTSSSFIYPFNYKPIRIDDIKLSSTSGLSIDESSYGVSGESIVERLKVDAKFNNLTAYYNMATNVISDSMTYSMIYTDGFLKFGYTPTYNLLDYLESINDIGDPNPKFYATKEYYAMPDLRQIPMPGVNSFTLSTVYVDYNGMTAAQGLTVSSRQDNKILFGSDLSLEWESIFVNTFVDVNLYATSSSTTTERALVTKKYKVDDPTMGEYFVVEFHKPLNYTIGDPLYYIDIISRRKLSQISDDLQQINLLQRPIDSTTYTGGSGMNLWSVDYTQYKREMNFKVNTDSYAKVLLSDVDTIQSISAILYTDYKNEYSMNITRLGREVTVPILNTANFAGNLFISCSEKHGLKDDDGVVLEFNGATGSSQELNQQYFGYHPIKKVNEYNFYVEIPYGSVPLIGNDTGYVRYYKQDPFLNYQPVDIIDVGIDKKGKIAIELNVENTVQTGEIYSLRNVDFSKYRFRLVDGLNIESLAVNYPWIYEAEISGAVIGEVSNNLVWYKGTWECGRWFGGTWVSGYWKSGDWYDGIWSSKLVVDNYINVEIEQNSLDSTHSTWVNGRWYGGTWENGTWINGRWYGGTWNNGIWYKGIWNDGTWDNGKFNGGIWVLGKWNNGIFNCDSEPSYWLNGYWYGGDFENGMWYNGVFEQKNSESRFGSKASNSRTATWHGGKWVNGSFHSLMNINDNDEYDVSETHKYSIWYTGQWFDGNFYGGVAYNMDFKSGTWHGGILEDIQVIGLTGSTASSDNYFILNGIFKFNIGDEITIIDNQIGNTYSSFGSNDDPQKYKVLYTVEDTLNKRTNVYVDREITSFVTPPVDLGIRVVSNFNNCNWKSGIWTNGIFNSGLWEGGIWYNGVFGNEGVWM